MVAAILVLGALVFAQEVVPASPAPAAATVPSPPAKAKKPKPARKAPLSTPPAEGAKAATDARADAPTPGADESAADAKKPVVVPTPRPKAPDIPSYRIAIKMKSGRRFLGVVSRDKAFHELVHAGAHHSVATYKRTERFTLRFVDGLDGEIELAWSQIARIEVREILDSAGVRAMEDTYASTRVIRESASEVAGEAAPVDGTAAPAEGDAARPEGAPADGAAPGGEKPKEEMPLLTEFSPKSGWSPDRKKQIEWRRTVVGTFPDAREQRFLDVYDQWLPAWEKWEKEQAAEAVEEAAKSKGEARGAKRADGEPRPEPKPEPKQDGEGGKPATAPPKDETKEPAKDPAKEQGGA